LRFLIPGLSVAAALVFAASPGRAESSAGGGFPRIDGGARGTALAGALTAIADGPEAITWNPAGLLSLERKEVSFTYSDLFGLGLVSQSAVQFGWPRLRKELRWEDGTIRRVPLPPPAERALGFLLGGLRGELGGDAHYLELQAGVAYAWRLPLGARAGAVYRFLDARSDLEDTGGEGHAVDLGLQRPLGPLRLGVCAANLASSVRWRTSGSGSGDRVGLDEPLARRWSLGLGWEPRRLPLRWTVQGDWEGDAFHLLQRAIGLEWRAHSVATLRGGFRQREDALGTRSEWSGGVGLAAGGFRIDYALAGQARGLGETHRWTAGLAL
jgi:hypothetical protein